jgi:hypothetical protein
VNISAEEDVNDEMDQTGSGERLVTSLEFHFQIRYLLPLILYYRSQGFYQRPIAVLMH